MKLPMDLIRSVPEMYKQESLRLPDLNEFIIPYNELVYTERETNGLMP